MQSLNHHFRLFLEQIGQSKSNRYNYTRRLRSFLETHGHHYPHDIKPAHINQWIKHLQTNGWQEATLSGYRQAIKTFFNYLVRENEIPHSPAQHVKTGAFISKRNKLPVETDVQKAKKTAESWAFQSSSSLKIRNGTIWLLSCFSGLRLRELRELRKTEVVRALAHGPDAHGIYHCTSYGKTKEVQVRFDQHVAHALQRWLDIRPKNNGRIDRCFITLRGNGRMISKSGMIKAFGSISKSANCTTTIMPHALRHRRGHNLYKKHGAKVTAMALNHRDWQTATTAIAYYHHPEEDDVSKALVEVFSSTELNSAELNEMNKLFGVNNDSD